MTYETEPVPNDPKLLAEYIRRQFEQVASNLQMVSGIQLDELHVEPKKPRTGMITLADGSNWNPGFGQGFYGFYNGIWRLLGTTVGVNFTEFTGNGTLTRHAKMVFALLFTLGGGAGGGGVNNTGATQAWGGGGGGAGGYSIKFVTAADFGASQSVTIGGAGAGGAAGSNNGAAGGDTSIGTLCIGKGASGGTASISSAANLGGLGGIAGTGDLRMLGMPGGTGDREFPAVAATVTMSGFGASSPFGSGGRSVGGATTAGQAATGRGAGGSGGYSWNAGGAAAGGDGSPGYAFGIEFLS